MSTPPSRRRLLASRLLVLLGAVFTVLALVAGFVRFQALDTDTVRETASLMIADDEIRNEVAASMVDSLFANVDVSAALEEQLPEDQQGLAGPLSAAVRELADRSAVRLLERPRAQELWIDTVEFSHQEVMDVLEDDLRGVETDQGAVFLDLGPLIVELGERIAIVGRLAERLPEENTRIKVMDAEQLESAQDLTNLLRVLGMWLWIVPLLLWAAALWLAEGRRRAVLRTIAVASVVTGLVVLALRRLGGSYVVDSLAETESARTAAQHAWDILTRQLVDGGWTAIGLGVILLVAVWVSGAGRSAVATRTELAPFLARPELAYGAAAVLFVLLLIWAPTVQTTRAPLMLAAAVLLALGVELLRRLTTAEHPEARDVELGAYARERVARLRGRGAT